MKMVHFSLVAGGFAAAFAAGAIWGPFSQGFGAWSGKLEAPAAVQAKGMDPGAPPRPTLVAAAPIQEPCPPGQAGAQQRAAALPDDDGSRTIQVGEATVTVSGGASVTVSQGGSVSVVYGGGQQYEQQVDDQQADDADDPDDGQQAGPPCPPPKAAAKASAKAKPKAAPAKLAAAGFDDSAAWAAGGPVDASTRGAAERELASGEPTLVVFHAVWRPCCKAYLPEAKAWAAKNGVKVVFIDAEKRPDLAKAAGVDGYPSTLSYRAGKPATAIASGNLHASGLAGYAARFAPFPKAAAAQSVQAAASAAVPSAPPRPTRRRRSPRLPLVASAAKPRPAM